MRAVDGAAGFVPTMGAFHEGHLELMRRAKAETGFCAISLFVNPTQFSAGEDFDRYPRQEERDFEMAQRAGVDLVFAPTPEEMYAGGSTTVKAGSVAKRWEGERRPGHFDGVATVVAKLFHIVRPQKAYFGEKDYQQCRVLAQMVADLDMPVELVFCETVREPDGLAMSSRNAYLSEGERVAAPALYRMLSETAQLLRLHELKAENILRDAVNFLGSVGFQTDYLAWVDGETLEPIFDFREDSRLLAAAKLGSTRLIDNCAV